MKIGIDIGTSKSPDAAAFAEEPLGYEYTWAFDASKQTSVGAIGGASTYGASIVADGIHLSFDASSATAMVFQEGDFTAGSVSSLGSGTEIIPDGAIPGPGAHVGHPGRYLSTVVTIDSLTIADGSIGGSTTLFGFVINTQGAGSHILITILSDPDDPIYVNGTSRSGAFSQSEIDGLIGSPIAITWDLGQALENSSPNDDPSVISLYPAYNEDVAMEATIHGFIFSATPPNIKSLPVHISNPSI